MNLRVERDGDLVTWILTGDGPVLTLTEEVFADLEEAIGSIGDARRVILTSDRDDHFCAGADRDAIASVVSAEEGEKLARHFQDILQRIEDSRVPVVAAMPGLCLGGGLELALACHARVAGTGARLGLPEVRVGILPGMGGTQRLPRLIGLKMSLPMLKIARKPNAKTAQGQARRADLDDADLAGTADPHPGPRMKPHGIEQGLFLARQVGPLE